MTIQRFETLPHLKWYLLDFDGVVADTESAFDAHDGAVLNALLKRADIDRELDKAEVRALAGIPFPEKPKIVAAQYGFDPAPHMDEILSLRNEGRDDLFSRYNVMIARNLKPFFEANQCRTGLVTNKDSDRLARDMSALKLAGYFSVRVCLSPAFRRKPAPDLLFEGIRRLGANPAETAYVGDNELDMQAARAAGIVPLGFVIEGLEKRPERAAELRAAGAAAVFDDFSDLQPGRS